jgi:SAM-dependent methyltransferase
MSERQSTNLTWSGRTGPFEMTLDPRVFTPTHTTHTLAQAMDIKPGDVVIDVGCGGGVLSLVAARLGAAKVYGVDLSEAAVEIAWCNARSLGLEDVVDFRVGSLLAPIRDVQADVVIGDVSGIPDPVAAESGWFPEGRAGGPTGSELPIAMLDEIAKHGCLKPNGRLYLPTGTIQAEDAILARARSLFGEDRMTKMIERDLPLPPVLAQSKAVADLQASGVLKLTERGSRMLWRLQIWQCNAPAPAYADA